MAASLLDRVAPADPVTFPLTVSALVLVAAAAGYVPALRASHVDPISALRSE